MHNAAFAHLNLDWAYVPLPVSPDAVPHAIAGLSALSFRGANVTIPHKEAALKCVDELSDEARIIGAVNTIIVDKNGRTRGENTDARGFLADLNSHGIDPVQHDVVVLGAGGSARAILYALLKSNCRKITVVNRHPERAKTLIADMLEHFPTANLTLSSNSSPTLTINCTPPAVEFSASSGIVYDLSYNNPRADAATHSGIGMLIHQGALSFEMWTGQKAPIDVMAHALGV
jgi:shikimate dehydrogenase